MEARAELRQVRISPRKVGVVLDLIRNKPCDMAMAILKHTPKSASEPLQRSSSSQQWQTQRTITQWIFPSAMFQAATLAPALL